MSTAFNELTLWLTVEVNRKENCKLQLLNIYKENLLVKSCLTILLSDECYGDFFKLTSTRTLIELMQHMLEFTIIICLEPRWSSAVCVKMQMAHALQPF